MSQPTYEELAAEVQLLREALRVRMCFRKCPECGAVIDDGLEHYSSCRFSPVEARIDQGA